MKTFIPEGYKSPLGLYDTQKAIGQIKSIFQIKLCSALHLKRVTAPLFVDPATGLNDNLSGVERPVGFDIPATGSDAEIVQSLAKWKRLALKRYGFFPGNGLITDMNAIRRDEELDNIHSIYVDQWDWEKVITADQRSTDFLEATVRRIVSSICGTLDELRWTYDGLNTELAREVKFITSDKLENLYPGMTAKERENAFTREYGTVFIEKIGTPLSDGKPHDSRAPDYDDWELNGDLLFWHDTLGMALEISSMGIRVDEKSMASQLAAAGCTERSKLLFHRMVLSGELPLTIGGGIGQSRLCMLLLGKAHIGEVQASIWDEETMRICSEADVLLL